MVAPFNVYHRETEREREREREVTRDILFFESISGRFEPTTPV